jgi:hypothetical protein
MKTTPWKQYVQAKLKSFSKSFSEAWTACGLMMVQGDLTVFSANHAVVAAKTGVTAGLGVVIVSSFMSKPNKWALAWVTGFLTMLADVFTHPTQFGPWWMESAATGLGAGVLAIVFSTVLTKKRQDNESN